ncbi:hypothetical protein PtrM4_103330 [Pyrenophora tritici-repentis]|uniref:Uncharacterized protein n=1 Tax=Pyrenophora tritici-repentis TaxID=45151 RepID=A0A834RV08_9PLEO|nr:hypothetical protein PtrM4_103330 [Pyrenophora tritici-repentis]
MIGLLFLAISPLLSTVSAVCCLPNNPPGAPNLDCVTGYACMSAFGDALSLDTSDRFN